MSTGSAYLRLPPPKRLFVDLVCLRRISGTEAVRQIRPHLRRPEVLASKWKADPLVRQAIEERLAEAMEQAGITNADILLGLARIANANIKDFVHEDGRPKAIHELDDDIARTVQSIEVTQTRSGKIRTKFYLPSKIEARRLLGQYKRLFTDRVEHTGANGGPIRTVTRVELVPLTSEEGGST